ncbi:hypothetical protein AVEN_95094-1 [Araneus ventricosus]|uniref:Uncharacterized protein n=1 Tax=Araneus ventricosus TaxID=182803 RepID=A0A4Y2NWN5_ARAVE|nr:hypothetical protein AVEN_95094-1 [Araneus ventricosus]
MQLIRVPLRKTLSVGGNEVAVSPNVIENLIYSPQSPAPAPSTLEAILITRGIGRQPATRADTPAYVSYGAPPTSRFIPGQPYGIYGYSSGAYTYYSPSVLSPYSYGYYGSYGSYPYGYLYKKGAPLLQIPWHVPQTEEHCMPAFRDPHIPPHPVVQRQNMELRIVSGDTGSLVVTGNRDPSSSRAHPHLSGDTGY